MSLIRLLSALNTALTFSPGKHINVLIHILPKIRLSAVAAFEPIKRLDVFVKDLQIRYAVDTVVADIVILIIVANQIILCPLWRLNWIGIFDDVFPNLADFISPLMQLFVGVIFEMVKTHLASFVDRLV